MSLIAAKKTKSIHAGIVFHASGAATNAAGFAALADLRRAKQRSHKA